MQLDKALLKMSKAFLGIGKSAKKGNKGLSMFRMLGQSIMFLAVFFGGAFGNDENV